MKKNAISSRRATFGAYWRRGYEQGYQQGLQSGHQQYGNKFEGTSIIIPTFNQLDLLKQCLESVERYTDLPYELIVIDNASTDGTARYLQSLRGQVRVRSFDENKGFAAAVNLGLMMAKGTTIVLLNNDILVTANWLRNMLICLESDPNIGMVGPVTNYISGEQQIKVPYNRVDQMPEFARKHNVSNPELWRDTEWLRGFCLLFRRELFEEIGYWDEGFEIGNYEDNDYNIRVRLAGKRLVIAADTFIHHYGSVSIKAIGHLIAESNVRNEAYYLAKWNDVQLWKQRMTNLRGTPHQSAPPGAAAYPQWVVVQGLGPAVYWIEGGHRHPIEGPISIPAVQLSQIDLRRWPIGEPVHASEVERKWRGLDQPPGSLTGIVRQLDGPTFHVEGGVLRQVISLTALESWLLHLKPIMDVEAAAVSGMPIGMPIMALPKLRQRL